MSIKKVIINHKNTLRYFVSSILTVGVCFDCSKVMEDACYFKKITHRFKHVTHLIRIKPKSFLAKHITHYQEYCFNRKKEIERQWIALFATLTDDEKMLSIHFLFECGCFGDESSREIMLFAKETSNPDYRYWVTQNIEKMTFYSQKGLYNNYYVDRKQLFRQITNESNFIIPLIKKAEGDSSRLCIVTYLLSDNIHNSMQRVASMVANRMVSFFSEVLVINLDSLVFGSKDNHKLTCMMNYKKSIKMRKGISKLFSKMVSVYYAKGNNYRERFQDALNTLFRFCPNLIIDITDEFSPISFIYNNHFKTAFLPLRFGASSSYYSAIIERKFIFDIWNEKYNFDNNSRVVDWYFPEYVPPRQQPYTRDELGISKDSFVLVSVGKCDDLCTSEFINSLMSFVKTYDNVVWLIVGGTAPRFMHDLYREMFEKRVIIERDFENNLRGLYAICDVHIRFNTVGGGGATAIAAMEGLPIAMTNYMCDAICWLGLDYTSNKNYEDLFEYVERLHNDKTFYFNEQTKVRNLVEKVLDTSDKWEDLFNRLAATH